MTEAASTKTTTSRDAGLGLLFLVGAGLTGMAVAGPWGGLAGVLYVGAARNLYRATTRWKDEDAAQRAEASKSATVGVLGTFLAIVATTQATNSRGGHRTGDGSDSDE